MGQTEVKCPHCGKGKAKITTDESGLGVVLDVKGLPWFALLKQTGPNEWNENTTNGIGFACKCGKGFFAYGSSSPGQMEVSGNLKEGLLATWLCESCRSAFVGPSLTCPSCGANFGGGV